jgi:hypothetical protein
MLATDETAAWRFSGIVWHDDGTSPALRFSGTGVWLPLLVGVAMGIKLGLACNVDGNLIWLIDTLEATSSTNVLDVSDRGTIWFPIMVIRGGEPGFDGTLMMFGDKFDA